MLKNAMVGGPSIVFKRRHEAGVTQIRPHRFKKTKECKRIIGYDANALYPSTIMREMPCGKEKVVRYKNPRDEAANFISRLKAGTWFGFAEVDIEILQKLWMKFEDMPPFFFTKQIPDEAVPQHMEAYMERTGRKRGAGKKLVGGGALLKSYCCMPGCCSGTEAWLGNHGSVSHHRLPGDESAEVVCG